MGAPSCIVYIGLRFSVFNNDIEALEDRRDLRQVEARAVGLESYWGDFGLDAPAYALFIGTQLGTLGPEGQAAIDILTDDLTLLIEVTRRKLASTSMSGEVGLHIAYHPDN